MSFPIYLKPMVEEESVIDVHNQPSPMTVTLFYRICNATPVTLYPRIEMVNPTQYWTTTRIDLSAMGASACTNVSANFARTTTIPNGCYTEEYIEIRLSMFRDSARTQLYAQTSYTHKFYVLRTSTSCITVQHSQDFSAGCQATTNMTEIGKIFNTSARGSGVSGNTTSSIYTSPPYSCYFGSIGDKKWYYIMPGDGNFACLNFLPSRSDTSGYAELYYIAGGTAYFGKTIFMGWTASGAVWYRLCFRPIMYYVNHVTVQMGSLHLDDVMVFNA